MTRVIVLLAFAGILIFAAGARAASGYLHIAEARTMQTRLAARMDTRLNAVDVTKHRCRRVDARHVNCPVTYHRYFDGVKEACPYTVYVAKRRVANGTETFARIDGWCGQEGDQ